MEKRSLVLAVALTLPLLLYGIPYAYAATTTQSTYVVRATFPIMAGGALGLVIIQCASPSDFTQHYAVSNPEQFPVSGVNTINSAGLKTNTGDNPNGWLIEVHNLCTGSAFGITAEIICQSPITVTVAGINVPEFGSLYVAIALGAVIYFALSRQHSGKRAAQTTIKA
jgi:hypothetical protein